MRVLLIRHAIAEPKIEEGGTQPDDRLRQLTPKGQRRMKRAARGLKAIEPSIDILATSPLARAAQTAALVAKVYDGLEVTTVGELAAGAGVDGMMEWLRSVETDGTIALVGHEPDLSDLAVHLLTAHHGSFLTLGKGGACLLEVQSGVAHGAAHLVWLLASRHLRRLGRAG
jgi:phosphohistidine phosphatase